MPQYTSNDCNLGCECGPFPTLRDHPDPAPAKPTAIRAQCNSNYRDHFLVCYTNQSCSTSTTHSEWGVRKITLPLRKCVYYSLLFFFFLPFNCLVSWLTCLIQACKKVTAHNMWSGKSKLLRTAIIFKTKIKCKILETNDQSTSLILNLC